MSKIHFSEEFYKRSFTADDMKSAYLKAVKWYASNVLSKAELQRVHVEFIKDEQSPTTTAIFVQLKATKIVWSKKLKSKETITKSC